jgi:hypothetical protein
LLALGCSQGSTPDRGTTRELSGCNIDVFLELAGYSGREFVAD